VENARNAQTVRTTHKDQSSRCGDKQGEVLGIGRGSTHNGERYNQGFHIAIMGADHHERLGGRNEMFQGPLLRKPGTKKEGQYQTRSTSTADTSGGGRRGSKTARNTRPGFPGIWARF